MSGNYEKWWSNNLFGEDEHYLHNGKKYKTPTIDEFSQEWMGTIDDPDRKFVREHILKFNTVLDVGCGGAPEYYGLKKINENIEYTGLDITPELVALNKKKNINCFVGSANSIPFNDSSFDVVHSRHVIEHMKDFKQPMLEFLRVARKCVLISFFLGPDLRLKTDWIPKKSKISCDNKGTKGEIYHNRYSRYEIKKLLKRNKKVQSFKYIELTDHSTYLLKINLN